ncbi:hotdog fold thioesterase [Galbitalea soli]|uniref:Hotdog fold thioesterase n=2 Tax=Galbitalea soli TaxID=1268042 RepID=A0A7C9TQC9_9MICO|nr:hotdog fold thioesterase [Galbitalea soli]
MFRRDPEVASLGITVRSVSPGSVDLEWIIDHRFLNSHGIQHGGFTFLLADTALAYCCASLGRSSVTRTAEIAFLSGVPAGARLIARAEVRAISGRTTICDVRVTGEDNALYAEFRGHAVTTATSSTQ